MSKIITDRYGLTEYQKKELVTMLSYKRPSRSNTENEFINKFIRPLGVEQDKHGNLWKVIGPGFPSVCYSSHTDTVHRKPGRLQVGVYKQTQELCVYKTKKSNCLGADDGVGVWIMINLIRERKPGFYVFHRGEERGGIGSNWIKNNAQYLFNGILFCLALDRKAHDSIITHQGGSRCCSNAFAKSLKKELDRHVSWGWQLDTGGSFTDSANYTDIIGECTNLSVAYYLQHTVSESIKLRQLYPIYWSLLNMDHKNLVYERKPGEKEKRTYYPGISESKYKSNYGSDYWSNKSKRNGKKHKTPQKNMWDYNELYDPFAARYRDNINYIWDSGSGIWVYKPDRNTGVPDYSPKHRETLPDDEEPVIDCLDYIPHSFRERFF